MNAAFITSAVTMRLVRHRALLQSLWWLAVGATMLCSCEAVVADPADVGPWRGEGKDGSAGVPALAPAPTPDVAQTAATTVANAEGARAWRSPPSSPGSAAASLEGKGHGGRGARLWFER